MGARRYKSQWYYGYHPGGWYDKWGRWHWSGSTNPTARSSGSSKGGKGKAKGWDSAPTKLAKKKKKKGKKDKGHKDPDKPRMHRVGGTELDGLSTSDKLDLNLDTLHKMSRRLAPTVRIWRPASLKAGDGAPDREVGRPCPDSEAGGEAPDRKDGQPTSGSKPKNRLSRKRRYLARLAKTEADMRGDGDPRAGPRSPGDSADASSPREPSESARDGLPPEGHVLAEAPNTGGAPAEGSPAEGGRAGGPPGAEADANYGDGEGI